MGRWNNKYGLLPFFIIILFFSCTDMEMNPLLSEPNTPFQTPAFDRIKTEHYIPALKEAIREASERIDEIASNPASPTFQNTVEALEFAGLDVSRISSLFFNLNSACTDAEMQQAAMEISPLLAEYSDDITLNEALFARIDTLYRQRGELGLNEEQARLLEETYRGFARNGAALSAEDKERFRQINKELSNLSLQFEQNLLAATNAYVLHLTDTAQLQGLPDFVVGMGREEAAARNLEGWVYTLQAPSYAPFLKFSADRSLRERIWRAYNSRCFAGGDTDNRAIVKRLVELRIEKARLLGYRAYSDYVLENRMARTTETVRTFLDTLLVRSLPFARAEVAEVQAYADRCGAGHELMPWDFSYYSEKLKDEKYALNDQLLKPYFKLENVREGVFLLAEKLYGLRLVENGSIPVYHPDVRAYEVYDRDGRFMAVLYLDFFPRESKNGGAWMTTYREQYKKDGKEYRPFVSVVCNFTKPSGAEPSLLTFYEVTTFLHEFGHALHGIFAEGTYPSLTGTNVARDFVELPSQIMENWALEKDFLALWAKHYRTGEAIPDTLVDRIVEARNFLSGYQSVRQLGFGMTDMAWHSLDEMTELGVDAFERTVLRPAQLMPEVEGTNFSVSFAHIFAGGYMAGYYGYKWAEVLEADAFSEFKRTGIFNTETASRFRETILSQGNRLPAMDLYVRFMGREPKMDALFDKLGLTADKQ